MKVIKYFTKRPLNLEKTDFLFTEIILEEKTKRLINFAVLQLLELSEYSFQIKKHDFSHGSYNIHCYFEKLDDKKEFPDPMSSQLYEACKKDIRENWFEYRERFRKKYLERKTI